MPASRAERRRLSALPVAILIILSSRASGAADLGPPIPLVPQQPQSTAPAAPTAAAPLEGSSSITQSTLAPTDASWAGTLTEDQGGLPVTLWQDTTRARVEAMLPLLAPSTSPALQHLARVLLLSNAAAPSGPDLPDAAPLASERADRLLALGDIEGAVPVLGLLPPDRAGDGLDKTAVELRFAAGDEVGACAHISDLINRYTTPWWQRALIACQALSGDGAKASLGLSVLRAQGAPRDPAFDALIDTLGGNRHRVTKLPDPTPLRLTLLAAAKEMLPASVLAAAGPAALRAYAASEAVPIEWRLAAAERAALFGALTPERLGALYSGIEASEARRAAVLADKTPAADPVSRAILYRVARSNVTAKTRVAAITALLDEARQRDAFPLMARLLVAPIGELQPGDTSAAFAGLAARALLVAGKGEAARPWIDMAKSPELALVSTLLIPPDASFDPATALHAAIADLAEHNAAAASQQADLLLALIVAFEPRLALADWTVLLAPPHAAMMPSAAIWIDQDRAAGDKRVGETMLTSILMLQAGERLSLEPMVLSRVISGLNAVGRGGEARMLAFEAAIDGGL